MYFIDTRSIKKNTTTAKTTSIKDKKIKEALTQFAEKRALFTKLLKRAYYRNDPRVKRPAFSEPKKTLDVTSRLLSGILCVFVYEKINQNKVMSGSTQYSKRKIFVLVPK